MTPLAPDGSRDRRIEDPTNLWIIHPCSRLLLSWFVSRRISANAVSVGGLALGALAALAYSRWYLWPFACAGFLLSAAWLVADGLDGMIARATGTANPLGRFLDGLCDHGVFVLIYIALAASIGTLDAWILGGCAGAIHALQSNLYEGERARFHRRCMGVASTAPSPAANRLVRMYDRLSHAVDSVAVRFDQTLKADPDPVQLGAAYGASAAKPLRLMSLLSANVRLYAIFFACIGGDPRLYWWFEILPLTVILGIGISWHRAVELQLIHDAGAKSAAFTQTPLALSKDEQLNAEHKHSDSGRRKLRQLPGPGSLPLSARREPDDRPYARRGGGLPSQRH
jgi:CDP-diacylglycerol---serine O-phosphatidyltransferase